MAGPCLLIAVASHAITCRRAARSVHGCLEMKGLGLKGRRATDAQAVLAGFAKSKLVPAADRKALGASGLKSSPCLW